MWAIQPDARPHPLVAILARGGAKSTNAELAAVAVGARRLRAYGLYVCGTQEQADDHVANVAALLESATLSDYYPSLTERAVGKFGNIKGWRRNRLRTASGFTLDALGLDTAARGIKVDDDRPGFIVIDDIDSENDTPLTTEKRIRALTKKVLPAGAQNLAVLAVQNLIHADSVFSQLADGRADFLADREMIGPIKAINDLTYEARDGRWILTGGTPTWAGQDLQRCQEMVDDSGLEAFLSEAQHDVSILSGGYFQKEWFPIVDAPPANARTIRFWDKAGTAPNRANPDPDWTRGARVSIATDRRIFIEDIVGIQADPGDVEALIKQTAMLDGKRVAVRIEQEPGSSGKDVIDHYVRNVLQGFDIAGVRSTGSKEERAAPVSSQAKVGNVYLVRGDWNHDFLHEAVRFPLGKHDDQVDAVSGAFGQLSMPQTPIVIPVSLEAPSQWG